MRTRVTTEHSERSLREVWDLTAARQAVFWGWPRRTDGIWTDSWIRRVQEGAGVSSAKAAEWGLMWRREVTWAEGEWRERPQSRIGGKGLWTWQCWMLGWAAAQVNEEPVKTSDVGSTGTGRWDGWEGEIQGRPGESMEIGGGEGGFRSEGKC